LSPGLSVASEPSDKMHEFILEQGLPWDILPCDERLMRLPRCFREIPVTEDLRKFDLDEIGLDNLEVR
jgi:hypothetical protein